MLLSRYHLLHLITDGNALLIGYTTITSTVPSVAKSGRCVAALADNTFDIFSCIILIDIVRLVRLSLRRFEDLRLLNLKRSIHG